jgi:hypothetical protein
VCLRAPENPHSFNAMGFLDGPFLRAGLILVVGPDPRALRLMLKTLT